MITPGYGLTATERVLPRMALDFTTASLDSRVTVTRALNTATRVNSSGFIETVNANLPRFDFSPSNNLCKGLLIEESRRNIVNFATAIGSWTINPGVTVVNNDTVSPTGLQDASTMSVASGLNGAYSLAAATNATVYTFSAYVKYISGNSAIYVGNDLNPSGALIYVNLSNGTITSSGAGISNPNIEAFKDGWYRVSGTFTSTGTTIAAVAGTVNGGKFGVWGVDIEAGAFPTSVILTNGAGVTRNADVVSMTGTNFSDWYNANEGALLVQATAEIPATDANVRFAAAIYDTAAYANAFRLERLSGNCRVIKTVSGSSLVASYSWPIDITGSAIMAYKDSNSASSFRAATPGLYAGGVPSGMAYLGIGGSHVGSNVWCGHVQRVMYWPQRVINAETQAFTK